MEQKELHKLDQAFRQLNNAVSTINQIWMDNIYMPNLDQNYPFKISFDELVPDIQLWVETQLSNIRKFNNQ